MVRFSKDKFIKGLNIIKDEGFGCFFKRTIRYLNKYQYSKNETRAKHNDAVGRNFVDVMFIDGCGDKLPQCSRYRVKNQMEQLAAGNISSNSILLEDLNIDHVRYANNFVFYRCSNSSTVQQFIARAKQCNKHIFFDIDDLVFDTYYTDKLEYVNSLPNDQKQEYDNYVCSVKDVLLCADTVVTTTPNMRNELIRYCSDVIVNRNCISEEVYALSCSALNANNRDDSNDVVIGYFSGSITHNADFEEISNVIADILNDYENTRLLIVGFLSLPECLESYRNRIEMIDFVDYRSLPSLINRADINIAPLNDNVFNRAKSEIKWIEAALLKKPTVASGLGSFTECIQHGDTGFLCNTCSEWYETLSKLIEDKKLRNAIGCNAFKFCKCNYLSTYCSHKFAKEISSRFSKTALFDLPGLAISGGLRVALKHASILANNGFSVSLSVDGAENEWCEYDNAMLSVFDRSRSEILATFDIGVATFWATAYFVSESSRFRNKFYLVQNYEPDFYPLRDYSFMNKIELMGSCSDRVLSTRTYCMDNLTYITISKWCQDWLESSFNRTARYARNGIDTSEFTSVDRIHEKRRILVEGDSSVDYKRVDETFEITNRLAPSLYEVWYLSYNGKPKDWYRCDRFYNNVAYDDVSEIYKQCDVLIKSSVLESFSYPPLEMMATGGAVVLVENNGNSEYVKNGYNCLTYKSGDIDSALNCIERIFEDEKLRLSLRSNGLKTALERDWKSLETEILNLYNI